MTLYRIFLLLCAIVADASAAVGEDGGCPVIHIVPERLPDLNIPRAGHSVFYTGGELVVAGGHTDGFVPTATAEYLSGDEWHQVPMTYTHDHGTALVLRSGKVLLAGGSKEEMGVGQSFGVEMYDPASHSFTGFGCLDQKRTLASAMELESGRVIITGNWYADDGIELFDGQKFFTPVKPVTVERVVPYLFRTSQGDVLIVSDRDTRDHLADTIVIDRLHGQSFTVPLLQLWKPLTYNAPTTADVGFIGDEAQGRYAYLMAVKNYERTSDIPELKGQPAGQIAIVLVEDTVFTLLPTVCPIPMISPVGTGLILYDRGYVVADRQAQRAYLCGIGKDKRLYVVSIGYSSRPAPLTLYYTDPLPDCGFYVPALTPKGNLAIVGGISKSDYNSDNFTPTASAWLIPMGQKDNVTATGNRRPDSQLWWLSGIAAGVLIGAWLVIRKRKAKAVHPVQQTTVLQSREEPSELETDTNPKSEELLNRICQLMDEQQLFRNSELKAADVAAKLGTNSRYVADCIRECRGITFTQLVNEYRVGYVQQLLRQHPDKKVIEAYTEAGFTSERSFFRIFKDVTGMTTTEWLSRNIG